MPDSQTRPLTGASQAAPTPDSLSPASPAHAAHGASPAGPVALIILAGCAIAAITFGPRAVFGLFLVPMSNDLGWGRDVFGLAVAVQNLLWGIGSPFAGAIADRFGLVRVMCVGALLYGAGLALMAWSMTPGLLYLSAGVLVGFGLSAASFNLVLAAFGKLLPDRWKALGFGAATAAGSFGQFLFPPLTTGLIGTVGWQDTLMWFGLVMMLVIPLSFALSERHAARNRGTSGAGHRMEPGHARPSSRAVFSSAVRYPSYVFLVLGFFTCGFQLAFFTVHLPAYLVDKGMSLEVGAITLALIGLCNIVGSLSAGYLSSRMSNKWLLAWIYAARGVAIMAFVAAPVSPMSCYLFGAALGLLWLSTVPPTTSLVMLMFGTRDMAMLYGFAFFSHQVGGFFGVFLGGELYEATGSYDWVWWGAIALSFASAAINLPIRERPARLPAPITA